MKLQRIGSGVVAVLGVSVALEALAWARLEATYGDRRAGAMFWTTASVASLAAAIVALWLSARSSAWNRSRTIVLCACGLLISSLGTVTFHLHVMAASMGVKYGFDGAHRWLVLSIIGYDACLITSLVCTITILYGVGARFIGKHRRAEISA